MSSVTQEHIWELEARLISLSVLLSTGEGSFLDQWEFEELRNRKEDLVRRSKLTLLKGDSQESKK